MFTGIVQGTATLVSVTDKADFKTFEMACRRALRRASDRRLGGTQRSLPDGDGHRWQPCLG